MSGAPRLARGGPLCYSADVRPHLLRSLRLAAALLGAAAVALPGGAALAHGGPERSLSNPPPAPPGDGARAEQILRKIEARIAAEKGKAGSTQAASKSAAAESKPAAETKPATEAKPTAGTQPTAETKPTAESKPTAETKPATPSDSNPAIAATQNGDKNGDKNGGEEGGGAVKATRLQPGRAAIVVAAPAAQARRALWRAHEARTAGDTGHARRLDGLALEWAETARDVLRAADTEAQTSATAQRARKVATRLERARALLAETQARRGRAAAELERIEAEAREGAKSAAKVEEGRVETGKKEAAKQEAAKKGGQGEAPAQAPAKPAAPKGGSR